MRRISFIMVAMGIFAMAAIAMRATAQDAPAGPTTQGAGGPKAGGPPKGPPGFHLLPRGVAEKLNLTADQKTQIEALEKETKAKLDAILTADQQKILSEMRPPRHQGGPGGGQGGSGGGEQGGPGGTPPSQ